MQEIVEVERAHLAQPLVIQTPQPRDHPVVAVGGGGLERRRVDHVVLRPADRTEDDRRPELAGGRQVLGPEDLLDQRLLVVRVVDDEARADPDGRPVAAQDAGTDRVERACLDVPAHVADEADDPLPQLRRGPIRERDGQDLPRPDALDADQVRDTVGEDPRLAAPGTREDQQRAVGGGDGACLLGVEAGDDPRGEDRGPDRLRSRRGLLDGLRGRAAALPPGRRG